MPNHDLFTRLQKMAGGENIGTLAWCGALNGVFIGQYTRAQLVTLYDLTHPNDENQLDFFFDLWRAIDEVVVGQTGSPYVDPFDGTGPSGITLPAGTQRDLAQFLDIQGVKASYFFALQSVLILTEDLKSADGEGNPVPGLTAQQMRNYMEVSVRARTPNHTPI